MKAMQISETGGPEVLAYVELETPTPGAGQVLVRTESISINFADVLIRQGLHPMMPPLPTVRIQPGALSAVHGLLRPSQ